MGKLIHERRFSAPRIPEWETLDWAGARDGGVAGFGLDFSGNKELRQQAEKKLYGKKVARHRQA